MWQLGVLSTRLGCLNDSDGSQRPDDWVLPKGHVRSSAGRTIPGNSLPYVHTALPLPGPGSILLSTRVVQSLHGAKMGAVPRYWKGLGCRGFCGMCAWSGYWSGALAAEAPVHPVVTGLQDREGQALVCEEEENGE